MKRRYYFLLVFILTMTNCSNWNPDYKNAHPKAKELMKDEFLWNPIDENSPFGNDDGADAVYKFKEWRQHNKKTNTVNFIEKLLIDWNYKTYNFQQADTIEIEKYLKSSDIGVRMFIGIDDAIIATGFGQLILEGKIDKELKELTLIAIERQLMPFSLNLLDKSLREERADKLKRMKEIINAA